MKATYSIRELERGSKWCEGKNTNETGRRVHGEKEKKVRERQRETERRE